MLNTAAPPTEHRRLLASTRSTTNPGRNNALDDPIEKAAALLVAPQHLNTILQEPDCIGPFAEFLRVFKPNSSYRVLQYYLKSLKAVRGIDYANAVSQELGNINFDSPVASYAFAGQTPAPVSHPPVEERLTAAFQSLIPDFVRFLVFKCNHAARIGIEQRVVHGSDQYKHLGRSFCMMSPAFLDNPIVFASEEFVRITGKPRKEVVGYNWRFLLGPKTDPIATERIRQAMRAGRYHTELLVNYHINGSVFISLLTLGPLRDLKGDVVYIFLSLNDVTELVHHDADLPAFRKLLRNETGQSENRARCLRRLSEILDPEEVDVVRRFGGTLERAFYNEPWFIVGAEDPLRILFTSPGYRLPGLAQSELLLHLDGPQEKLEEFHRCLLPEVEPEPVIMTFHWVTTANGVKARSRERWFDCTPMQDGEGRLTGWLIQMILVDEPYEVFLEPTSKAGKGVAIAESDDDWDVPLAAVLERLQSKQLTEGKAPQGATSKYANVHDETIRDDVDLAVLQSLAFDALDSGQPGQPSTSRNSQARATGGADENLTLAEIMRRRGNSKNAQPTGSAEDDLPLAEIMRRRGTQTQELHPLSRPSPNMTTMTIVS
ncbi:hypothetical protein M011DRAFT_473567 [Sporormia fimetaria CBS 119925]|uniref:PAC domain-containing protein n=1 Tax=Sporormia fimetaria CBS 119925 TaxID=1340428 RepID=A0A6A6VNY3_9PLEO|nr:hypothetical protein M011DRAFT_473567 [Sporormia fimetaria CBS 119925]